jgi:hypothetical protein
VSADTQQREQAAMDAVIDRLINDFAGEHDDREITQVIGATYQQFETAPIRDFVPILVERYTREELSTTT